MRPRCRQHIREELIALDSDGDDIVLRVSMAEDVREALVAALVEKGIGVRGVANVHDEPRASSSTSHDWRVRHEDHSIARRTGTPGVLRHGVGLDHPGDRVGPGRTHVQRLRARHAGALLGGCPGGLLLPLCGHHDDRGHPAHHATHCGGVRPARWSSPDCADRAVDIVLGKFLGAFGFLAVLDIFNAYMPALIFVHGKVSLAQIAVGYAGVLSLGATSPGTFTSMVRN